MADREPTELEVHARHVRSQVVMLDAGIRSAVSYYETEIRVREGAGERLAAGLRKAHEEVVTLRAQAQDHQRALLAVKAELEQARAGLGEFARWIATRVESPPTDHACAECVPGGEIVVVGFVCVPHQARKIAEVSRG